MGEALLPEGRDPALAVRAHYFSSSDARRVAEWTAAPRKAPWPRREGGSGWSPDLALRIFSEDRARQKSPCDAGGTPGEYKLCVRVCAHACVCARVCVCARARTQTEEGEAKLMRPHWSGPHS